MALSKMEQELAARKRDTAYLGTLNRKADFMEKEQAALDRQGDVFARARARRIDANREIARNDPGRFSPFERNALLGLNSRGTGPLMDRNERNGLLAHELKKLDKQGENEFKVAEQKRLGMREQGADAAGHNAEATKYGWDKQLEVEQERQKGGLTLAEKQIASQERIAGMEHGTIGADGTVTPGSRERVAGINADAVAQQAELKRQHELELEREKTLRNADTNQTRVVVGAGHDQARRDAAGAQQQRADKNAASRVDQDVMQGKYLESGMTPGKWKAMSEEERAAFRKSVGVSQSAGGNQPPARRSWRDRYEAANK